MEEKLVDDREKVVWKKVAMGKEEAAMMDGVEDRGKPVVVSGAVRGAGTTCLSIFLRRS